jgi:NAD(P)-dependent dehydrogenase (short-subunit alcohol dehydrogenase family)
MSEILTDSILITGASTGIGLACAIQLDSLGYQVFAGYRRPEDAEKLRSNASDRLVPVPIDVTDPLSIGNAVKAVRANLGEKGLYGLVNNAGIALAGPIEFVPIESLREQFEVNVLGQVAVTQAFLADLRQSQGRIVNISSFSGRVAFPFLGPYAASKHALEALSDSLRVELRPWNIRVSVIEPGRIHTPIWEKSLQKAEEFVRNLPAEAQNLYGPMLEYALDTTLKKGRMLPVEVVVEKVVHALTAKRPKPRYLVGRKSGRRLLMMQLAPTWLRDWMVAKRLNPSKE